MSETEKPELRIKQKDYHLGLLEQALIDLAYDEKYKRIEDPRQREMYVHRIIRVCEKKAEEYGMVKLGLTLENTHMKKSELKSLLKIIAEEVITAKQQSLNETKGLSGFKETKDSTEHTEKIADSKDLTGKTEPKEQSLGKKLPVVKKPATPKGASIKEEILSMIREAIDEANIEEMARTAGSVAPQYRKEIEPGKWVIIGHPNQTKYPDGTPTTAPKGPYVPKGTNPNMGRPKTAQASVSTGPASAAETARTEEAVEEFIKYNPNATEQEVMDAISDKSTEETPLNLDPAAIKNAIQKAKQSVGAEKTIDEPSVQDIASAEKTKKARTMNSLRAYLMRKKGIK